MNRLLLSLVLIAATMHSYAQIRLPPRTIQQVQNSANIVEDRGVKLEVLPTERAVSGSDISGGQIVQRVTTSSADTAIGPRQLGVVFNHVMQQQGYISGEIAFKMKAGFKLSGFPSSSYPGLKKITNPEVYVVNTRTPAEFMTVLKRLQARGDLEWVEPTISYGLLKTSASIR